MTRELTPTAPLPRNVIVLSWVSLFQDAASEMLYPVLPLFLTGVLGAPASVVGLVEGVAEGTASAVKALSGRLADVRRRRPLIAGGYGISSVAKLAIGAATVWPMVLVARFVDRVGKGMRAPPRDALIAGETDRASRGRAFGFHRAMDSVGAIIGPLAGLGLYEVLHHRLRPLFFVAFVPAAISVALVALVRERPVRERPVRERPVRDGTGRTDPPSSRAGLPAPYRRVVAFLALFGLVNFPDALLILRAKQLGLGFAAIIGAYALYNAVYAGLSYPAGRLSDRMPRRLVFGTGLVIFAVAYLGLGLATSPVWAWVLLPVYGGYTALTDGVGKAWIADLLPPGAFGAGLGLYQGLAGGTAVLAGAWAGLAWGAGGRLPLMVSGSVAGALAGVLLVGGRRLEVGGRRRASPAGAG